VFSNRTKSKSLRLCSIRMTWNAVADHPQTWTRLFNISGKRSGLKTRKRLRPYSTKTIRSDPPPIWEPGTRGNRCEYTGRVTLNYCVFDSN
jgi:hypothetical protein